MSNTIFLHICNILTFDFCGILLVAMDKCVRRVERKSSLISHVTTPKRSVERLHGLGIGGQISLRPTFCANFSLLPTLKYFINTFPHPGPSEVFLLPAFPFLPPLYFPPISPSFQLFLSQFSLLPILFLTLSEDTGGKPIHVSEKNVLMNLTNPNWMIIHLCQHSRIIREFPGLPYQISRIILMKAHKIHFSDIFWPIFGIFGGKMVRSTKHFCGFIRRALLFRTFLGSKRKLAISRILNFLGPRPHASGYLLIRDVFFPANSAANLYNFESALHEFATRERGIFWIRKDIRMHVDGV